MQSEFKRVKEVFLKAAEIGDPGVREAFLGIACADDAGLRQQVDALLLRHEEAGSFLARPAIEAAGTGAYAPGPDPTTMRGPAGGEASSAEGPGNCIGSYRLVQVLGEGGMGTVYVAEQEHPVKRRVALKLIKPGMDSARVIRRFEAERQALALMDHSNIARVFDAGTTAQGRPYFVMELIKGVPITKYCDELHLSIRERLELFVPVCQAIQHAHEAGVIHRDVKPSNVLVCVQDGKAVPKVIDFGVAKALHQRLGEESMNTEIGAVVGTLEYMSPEQAELSVLDVDARADVYALGVLLYELLTGTTPLDKLTLRRAGLSEMLRVIREEEPPRPSTRLTESKETLRSLAAQRRTVPTRLRKEVRGELDWIVMRCLEKDRTRRYEAANSLARDVERYLADETVEACPPSVSYRVRKFARRKRGALLTAACLGGLAVAIAVGGWFYREVAEEAEQKRNESDHARRLQQAHANVPRIEEAIRQEQHQRAFDLLSEIEPLLPDHPSLPTLREECSQVCSIASQPAGADVWRKAYDPPGAPWQHVLRTGDRPTKVRVPRGENLWRATMAGHREVTGLRPPPKIVFTLYPDGAIPTEMVPIPGGRPSRPRLALSVAFQSLELPAFLIDRHEVTNAEYHRFVTTGGYDKAEWWQGLAFRDAGGNATTWEKVRRLLVDKSARPGPATWCDGTFPLGEENHPVRGVSWYEAMAYARFAGKALPTIYHWVQASQIEQSVVLAGSPFITRSNFGTRAQSVKTLSDQGAHGAFGMAGNDKEWCCTEASDDKRFILGGACGEPIYVPITLDRSDPLERGEYFGFRCMKFFDEAKGPAAAWAKASAIRWPTPPRREELLGAETFRLVVRDRFAYDRSAPLEVASDQVDEGDWIHVTTRVNAAYRDAKRRWERLIVHLYLPKGTTPTKGHPAIVYFSPGDAAMLPRMRPLQEEYGLEAIVRSGRAVLRPIYKGMYQRRLASPPADLKGWEDFRTQSLSVKITRHR